MHRQTTNSVQQPLSQGYSILSSIWLQNQPQIRYSLPLGGPRYVHHVNETEDNMDRRMRSDICFDTWPNYYSSGQIPRQGLISASILPRKVNWHYISPPIDWYVPDSIHNHNLKQTCYRQEPLNKTSKKPW